MVSWKLSLLVLVAVFVILALDVEARRGNNRRNGSRGNRGEDDTESGTVSRRRNRGGGRRRGRGPGNGGDGNSVGTDVTGGDATDSGGRPGRGGRGRRPGAGSGGRGGRRRGGNRGRGGRGRGGRGRGGRGRGGRGPGSRPNIADRLRGNFVHATGRFGFDLYRHMANQSDNFAYSPIGVYACTTAALLGTNGQTKTQIIRALNIRSRVHPAFKSYNESLTFGNTDTTRMLIATGIFTRQEVNAHRRFKRKLRMFYNMEISNFSSDDPVGNVNDWASLMSSDEIPDFLADGDLSESDLIMLFSGIFFKGQWTERFDVQSETFTGRNSQSFDVETLSRSGNFRHKHSSALEASILEVPYSGDRFALYIVLPDTDTSLADMESRLSYEVLNETLGSLEEASAFNLKLPKFTMDTQQSMRTFLEYLGIIDMFQGNSANLRKLTRHRNAFISDIKHRAVLQVDEDGAEPTTLTDEADMEFNVNRPFVFIVRDNIAGINLFIGRYLSPQGDNFDE